MRISIVDKQGLSFLFFFSCIEIFFYYISIKSVGLSVKFETMVVFFLVGGGNVIREIKSERLHLYDHIKGMKNRRDYWQIMEQKFGVYRRGRQK